MTNFRYPHVLEASWDCAQDGKPGLLLPMSVHKPRNKYVEQDGECISKRGNEEIQLGSRGIATRLPVAEVANRVEEEERCKTDCCINLGTTEMLEDINDDMVRRGSSVETCDAHKSGYLANRNVQCTASHESPNC